MVRVLVYFLETANTRPITYYSIPITFYYIIPLLVRSIDPYQQALKSDALKCYLRHMPLCSVLNKIRLSEMYLRLL